MLACVTMNATHFLFNVLVVVGSFQGAVTGMLLWLSPRKNTSRRLLAGLLAVFVLLSCKILLHTLGLWHNPYLRYVPLAIDLVIQPLFYLYVLSLTRPDYRLTRGSLAHFLPAGIFFLHALVVYFLVLGQADLAGKDAIAESLHFNRVKRVEDYLSVLSAWVYWYLSYRQVSRYRQWLYDNIAAADYPEYTWLRNILLLTLVLFSVLALNLVLDIGFGFDRLSFLHWQFFHVYMSGLIYYLGFKGYHLPAYPPLPAPGGRPTPGPVESIATPAVSETDGLATRSLKAAIDRALADEKMYLDPDLSLAQLAGHLGISSAVLSATINTHYGKNFRNLINAYRVEEVKRKLNDPALSHLSILGIALESSFNSEASFYRIFKQHTSLSPTAYTAQAGKKD
jgi:AraC-like DNA-binding protein